MEICKAPTLRLKALSKNSITHLMYIEMGNISSKNNKNNNNNSYNNNSKKRLRTRAFLLAKTFDQTYAQNECGLRSNYILQFSSLINLYQ